jgi:hypothetical protein
MCTQSVTPKSDGPNQPIELPWLVEIANSLPADVDAPDWGVEWHSSRTENQAIVDMAKKSLARWGLDWDRNQERVQARKFQRFLDEVFPREQYAAFRDLIDGPDLADLAGMAISTPRSALANYRFVVTTRRALREGARLGSQIDAARAARARARGKKKKLLLLYPLRICAFCQKLFIARKNNNVYCDPKKCGAAFRQARKRDKDKQDEYEVTRQRKMAKKEQEQKLKKKELERKLKKKGA